MVTIHPTQGTVIIYTNDVEESFCYVPKAMIDILALALRDKSNIDTLPNMNCFITYLDFLALIMPNAYDLHENQKLINQKFGIKQPQEATGTKSDVLTSTQK